MSTESPSRFADVLRELLSLDVYKRTQGRIIRSMTMAGLGLMLGWGIVAFHYQLINESHAVRFGVPLVIAAICSWFLFRIYNWPRFADFLIATEAEMTKVSWSSKDELKRATAVVLFTLFLMAGFLLSVDIIWSWFLGKIGVITVRKQTEQALMELEAPRITIDPTATSQPIAQRLDAPNRLS